jgi:glycosyltransferase involved in cell wall biosynthesis
VTEPLGVALTVEQLWQRVPGGSGTYIEELVGALTERPDVAPRGLAAAHRGPTPVALGDLPVDRAPLPRRALYDAWNTLGLPRAEHVVGARADVVHATTWAVPPTRRPLVVTVHDLAFLHDATHFTPRGVRYFTRSLARTRDEAAVVVVPSRQTADDCAAHGIEPGRVRVVPHGVRVPAVDAVAVAAWRARHGVRGPYVLWTGTREPRKNLAGLLAAYRVLRAHHPDIDLVLVGPGGWGDAGVEEAPGVHLLGRLSPADLHAAYAGAAAFCFPSLREGFGMPVLEAMAHGVPVVTSAGTPMADLLGGDAPGGIATDPRDPGAVAAALDAVLDDRDRFAGAARAHASASTWRAAADATVAAYREATGTA